MDKLVIVGGGFSGTLFALKMAAACPEAHIVLVEAAVQAGPGLAYGACQDCHLLNVPVHRMEPGLIPSFSSWIVHHADIPTPVLEDGRNGLAQAFVPRAFFGAYLKAQLDAAISAGSLSCVQGDVVQVMGQIAGQPGPTVCLADGRHIEADRVVLATGNLPPKPPAIQDAWLYETPYFIADPWAPGALADVQADDAVLLIGTGLTMVDIALSLRTHHHRGAMVAVSRRGLLPCGHRAGGDWKPFIDDLSDTSPLNLLRILRTEIKRAACADVPWQRVMDAVRPALPLIWSRWNQADRRGFLRHLRPYWDVHRHRTAPRITAQFDDLRSSGQLETMAGRIAGYRCVASGIAVTVAPRGGGPTFERTVAHIVNCTGPRSDFATTDIPLFADLRERGLIVADPEGLGLETRDCALIDRQGRPSSWLYALGPLTRPAWWEVTAVPEITTQIDRLVRDLSAAVDQTAASTFAATLFESGAGI